MAIEASGMGKSSAHLNGDLTDPSLVTTALEERCTWPVSHRSTTRSQLSLADLERHRRTCSFRRSLGKCRCVAERLSICAHGLLCKAVLQWPVPDRLQCAVNSRVCSPRHPSQDLAAFACKRAASNDNGQVMATVEIPMTGTHQRAAAGARI